MCRADKSRFRAVQVQRQKERMRCEAIAIGLGKMELARELVTASAAGATDALR